MAERNNDHMKAILKSNRNVILDVELHYEWYYITERRTERTFVDKAGVIYTDNEIELLEYQGE